MEFNNKALSSCIKHSHESWSFPKKLETNALISTSVASTVCTSDWFHFKWTDRRLWYPPLQMSFPSALNTCTIVFHFLAALTTNHHSSVNRMLKTYQEYLTPSQMHWFTISATAEFKNSGKAFTALWWLYDDGIPFKWDNTDCACVSINTILSCDYVSSCAHIMTSSKSNRSGN